MLDILRDLPILLQLLLFQGVFILLMFGGYAIIRKTLFRMVPSREKTDDAVSFFGGALLSFFGIVAGLIIVAAWQNYLTASNTINKEAAVLSAFYWNVEMLPEPYRETLKEELLLYVDHILDEEWNAHRYKEYTREGADFLDRMQNQILMAATLDEIKPVFIDEAFRQFNYVSEARSARINTVLTTLSPVLWIVLLITILLSQVVFYYYHIPERPMRHLLFVLLGLFMGLIIFTIFSLDSPYRGGVRITPESYETLLEDWEKGFYGDEVYLEAGGF